MGSFVLKTFFFVTVQALVPKLELGNEANPLSPFSRGDFQNPS
jgi:hypothetical protein